MPVRGSSEETQPLGTTSELERTRTASEHANSGKKLCWMVLPLMMAGALTAITLSAEGCLASAKSNTISVLDSASMVCEVRDAAKVYDSWCCKTCGIGSNCSTKLEPPPASPIAWCTSGGGFVAMTMGLGFANSFHRAGLFDQKSLTDMASNSGGTWFLMQFAYNPSFYAKVTGTPSSLQVFVKQLLQAYDTVLASGVEAKAIDPSLEELSKLTSGDFTDAVVDCGLAVFKHDLSWLRMIEAMLDKTPGMNTSLFYDKTRATQMTRGTLQQPTLHFQATLLTASFQRLDWLVMNDPISVQAWLLDADGQLLAKQGGSNLPGIPVQYVVPGTVEPDACTKFGFQIPSSTMYNYHATSIAFHTPELLPTEQALPDPSSLSQKLPVPPLPSVLSLAKLASVSSAAAGALGSPLMMRDMLDANANDLAGDATMPLLQETPLSDLSICASDDVYCDFPNNRFADGAYVDNLATAQTVGSMQKQFGTKPLRLVLTDYVEKQPGDEASTTWETIFDVSHLFSRGTKEPGDILSGSDAPGTGGMNKPSPQVFAEKYDNIKWSDVPGSPHSRYYDLKYALVSTITVDNHAYGTTKGSRVDLLIFVFYSSLNCFDIGIPNQYASAAHSIAMSNATGILKEWLGAHEGQQHNG
mmetsp:Transcript_92696/g.206018  ORF Transcript_92696/g.206018 Transcript_92696/m.206018 type:complete len:642 (+) Transcript_92696:54-1979(+)